MKLLDANSALASMTTRAAASTRTLITLPAWFDLDPGVNVYRQGSLIVHDYDPTAHKASDLAAVTAEYWVDPVSGSDSNNGSETTPYQSIYKAVNAGSSSGNVLVHAKPGLYDSATAWKDGRPSGSLTVVPWGEGRIISSMHQAGLVWTLETGSTYKATIVTVGTVADLADQTDYGFGRRLAKQTSIANVDANPGSWWVSGTTAYVRTTDGREPDSDVRVYLNATNGFFGSDKNCYVENVDFHGGSYPWYSRVSTTTPVQAIHLNNCTAAYSADGDISGFNYFGHSTLTLYRCKAHGNALDGISYKLFNTDTSPRGVEIECVGVNNGDRSSDVSQGSSTHNGGRILRVNGIYGESKGPAIQDVNAAFSVNIGCTLTGSTSATAPLDVAAYAGVGSNDATQMHLDSCTLRDTEFDIGTVTDAVIEVHNTAYATSTGGGTITEV